MIELGTLTVKDFGCIKTAELFLARQGLVLIQGDNQDTSAADSNGSGKSTFFKALGWVLFGQTVDKSKGDDVIRLGKKMTEVSLDFTADDKAYTVTRTKIRGKSETLKIRYAKDRKSLGSRTLKEAQKTLEEILFLDWLTFKNTVLYGQGDIFHFADPRTTDSQRKAVLTKILRLERIEIARAIARERKNEATAKQNRLEGEIAVLKGQLEALDVADLKAIARRWDKERAERSKVAFTEAREIETDLEEVEVEQRKLKNYRHRLDDVQAILGEYQEQADERKLLSQRWESFNSDISNLSDKSKRRGETLEEIGEHITALEAGKCPTCGAPSSSIHVKRMIKGLRAKAGMISETIQKNEDAIKAIQIKQQEIQKEIKRIDKALADWDDWSERATQITDRINEAKIAIGRESALEKALEKARTEVSRIKSEPNPYSKQIKERRERAGKLRTTIIEKQTETKQMAIEIDVCAFWVEGFGPAGLASYLMDSVVPVVAERANRYLEILSDGDLRIKLDTLTQLKGGGIRDKLELTATVEGQEGVPMSGGQLKKVTLATDLALMDLLAKREGAAVDLLLLDEVLDGLDASGRARIMDLLEHLRSQRATIIVISHDPEIVEKFGKTINVVKKGGIARIAA